MSTDQTTRAWMEVDATSLRRNLARVRASVGPGPALIPMVKADGYGLGMDAAVQALSTEEPWGFGVATVGEGVALRAGGVEGPVVVFSPAPPDEVETAVEQGITLSLSSLDGLARLEAAAQRCGKAADFHLEVDTGMGRAGFDWRSIEAWAPAVAAAHRGPLRWSGCYTHLHSADTDVDTVHEQWRRFRHAVDRLEVPEGVMVHALNSAGALRTPEYGAGAVRPGIFLYGGGVGADLPSPLPVASVRARVVHVRDAPEGTTLGYGSTHVAGEGERWATLAIGYGDGLPRGLSNRGEALVRGTRVRIIGRISMDVTVVDISDAGPVEPGDVATLIGSDGDQTITVDDVATLMGTISYEVLTGFTPRVPRVWMNDVGS
jgi:alanine racemase